MRFAIFAAALLCAAASTADAQLKILATETLPLGTDRAWAMPQWSPDGSAVYYTASDFRGIWEYALSTRTVRVIATDEESGYGFAVSPDGKRVAYRRILAGSQRGRRMREAVVKDIADGRETVLRSGPDVGLPSFAGGDAVLISEGRIAGLTSAAQLTGTVLLGTDDNKIAVLRDGVKVLLDPLGGNGRYIWPALSPDGRRLAAYDMERGTFVADLDGAPPLRLGRRDAAVWTRDGRWLVYMDDADDGHAITGSEVACVSPDGQVTARLTATPARMEMYPHCSPVDDAIVCSTLEGEIVILRYAEAGR
jgi:Tol biopolymer transport system component